MSQPIQLIVGLGNPGEKYEKTRHNAGAWFVEELAQSASCALRPETKFQGKYASSEKISGKGDKCHLLVPTRFMNNSGQSVRTVAKFYNIPPEAILVVHDRSEEHTS